MLRHVVILAFLAFAIMGTARFAGAQDYAFPGPAVVQLAKAIVSQATTTNEIAAAYEVPIGQKKATITAPMAFEILANTLTAWKGTGPFPERITGLTLDLRCPPPKPEFEPDPSRPQVIPVLAEDIITYAPGWISSARSQNNAIPMKLTFPTRYVLTTAQYLLAMAMLIEKSQSGQPVPLTFAVPAVKSPTNWETGTPVLVAPPKQVIPVVVKIAVNGIDVSQPNAPLPETLLQPLCGPIRIVLNGSGPIAKMTMTLSGKEIATYSTGGSHGYVINSARLVDQTYLLGVTTIDAEGKSSSILLPLRIQNGRQSAFTPAEGMEQPATVSGS